MPTTVTASGARQAPQEEITPAPQRNWRLTVPDTFAQDMRQHGVIPRPLRDPEGGLLDVSGTSNHALKHAVETYQNAPPERGVPQDADETNEFYDVTCPVQLEPTTRPVQMGDGHTYDRGTAEQLNATGTFQSPITRAVFSNASPTVSAPVQELALYGHLVRHGDWRADTKPQRTLPPLPTQGRLYKLGAAGGVLVAGLGAGIGTAVSFMLRNQLPTLQLPACGLGNCGNVATQSFGSITQTHTVGITGTDVTWSLLNAVNTSGQAAVDACRVAAQACWESHVPLIQAFEHQADSGVQVASLLPYIGAAAGAGAAALILAGTWGIARRRNCVVRQARTEIKREGKEHVDLQARVAQMLHADLQELRNKQQQARRGGEIELMPLQPEGPLANAGALPAEASSSEAVDLAYLASTSAVNGVDADVDDIHEIADDIAGPSHSEAAETATAKTTELTPAAALRLQKDLKELKRNAVHYPGITAGPVGEDLSVWEAKIALVEGPLADSGKAHNIDSITLHN